MDNMPLTTVLGDAGHVVGILVLFSSILLRKSCGGISGKTQLLYAIIYTLRYMDLWFNWQTISIYNTSMKIYMIAMSCMIVHLIHVTFRESYERDNDNFPLSYLVVPVTFLAFLINHESSFIEICWTWSIYMEALALIPQLYVSWNTGNPPGSVVLYIFLLVIYRALHIPRWLHQYDLKGTWDPILVLGGILEVVINGVGFVSVLALKLQKCSCERRSQPSIYTLPHIVQQIGKDYKLLDSKFGDEEEDLYVRVSKSDVKKLSPERTVLLAAPPAPPGGGGTSPDGAGQPKY